MPKDNEVDEKVMPVAWQWLDTSNFRKNIPSAAIKEHWNPLYSAATVAELRAEVETCRKLLAEKVTAETLLRELHITPAGMAMQVEGGMAGVIAQCLVDQFHDIGGPNFFEMKFSADQQQYVLTVQRYGGLTPVDKMKAAQQRADAAERRVGELEKLMAAARRAIGDHHAPNDCYATGPMTGDEYLDLVQCPACAFLEQHATLTGADPT